MARKYSSVRVRQETLEALADVALAMGAALKRSAPLKDAPTLLGVVTLDAAIAELCRTFRRDRDRRRKYTAGRSAERQPAAVLQPISEDAAVARWESEGGLPA